MSMLARESKRAPERIFMIFTGVILGVVMSVNRLLVAVQYLQGVKCLKVQSGILPDSKGEVR